MSAAPEHIDDIDRGETYTWTLALSDPDKVPVDLTGQTAQIAIQPDSGDIIRITSDVTSTAGTVVIEPTAGAITIELHAATTAAITYAAWTLWLQPATPDAEALVSGTLRTRAVVPHG